MTWIIIALIAYALLALVSVGDKFLLSGPVSDPKVYTFYMCALGMLVLLAVPFLGFPMPGTEALLLALIAGGIYAVAAFILFSGMALYDASRIVPGNAAFGPIFALFFSFLILPDVSVAPIQIFSFMMLVAGGVVITWQKGKSHHPGVLMFAGLIAMFFSASYAIAKLAFMEQTFWSGFFWQRVGAGIIGVILLLSPKVRKEISSAFTVGHRNKSGNIWSGIFYVGNQAIGALAVILMLEAVNLATPSQFPFIDALQGIKFIFLLIFIWALNIFFPHHKLKEHLAGSSLRQKIWGVSLIAAGLVAYSIV